jgi:hypothetical protein
VDAATNGQRGLATYGTHKAEVNATGHPECGKKRETYGSGPFAETEEAHNLIKGLEEAFGKLGR